MSRVARNHRGSGSRMRFEGRTAVLTGAASGIGRALAVALARRDARLALVDVDERGMEETRRLIGAGTPVSLHHVDLSKAESIAALPGAVTREHPSVDLLFNVAGVALGGSFEQVAEADFDWLMAINFFGTVRTTRTFLPLLRAAPEGWIVNVSSIYGIVAPPGQAAYTSSKFAVRGFSNALREELRGSGVGVSVVHPGGVATAIADSARSPSDIDEAEVMRRRAAMKRLLRMPADQAAAIILSNVARRQARILVGTDARIAALLERLMPVSHLRVLDWLSKRGR